jgi:hypothetical protein
MNVKMPLKLIERKNLLVMSVLVIHVDLTFHQMVSFYVREMQMVKCGFGIGDQPKTIEQSMRMIKSA